MKDEADPEIVLERIDDALEWQNGAGASPRDGGAAPSAKYVAAAV